MLKTLPQTSHHLAICEGNFLRLSRLLNKFSLEENAFETINPDESHQNVAFLILNKTKHTLIIEAKQTSLKTSNLNNFVIKVHVSLDAKLAEVLSYQGEKPISLLLKESKIQSYDEKMQQNRFLTEWLESIFIAGVSSKDNIKNIIKHD